MPYSLAELKASVNLEQFLLNNKHVISIKISENGEHDGHVDISLTFVGHNKDHTVFTLEEANLVFAMCLINGKKFLKFSHESDSDNVVEYFQKPSLYKNLVKQMNLNDISATEDAHSIEVARHLLYNFKSNECNEFENVVFKENAKIAKIPLEKIDQLGDLCALLSEVTIAKAVKEIAITKAKKEFAETLRTSKIIKKNSWLTTLSNFYFRLDYDENEAEFVDECEDEVELQEADSMLIKMVKRLGLYRFIADDEDDE
ncbi:hypothetical protein [Carp edema virus]|nr:hypothetical protein [Carp edema virus]